MIHIFSTKVRDGKGGISTALNGYAEAFVKLNVTVKYHTTHSDSNKFSHFLNSFLAALKVKPGDVCWFHLGPWFSIFRKAILISVCKLKGGKIVIHFHSRKTHKYLNDFLGATVIRLLYILADHFVVLTQWWSEQFLDKGFYDKVIISPNPIDSQLVDYILSSSKDNNLQCSKKSAVITVLSMGRLIEEKGFEQTIKALKYLPDNYKLKIAGSGPLENSLNKLVQELHLSNRVQFLGWVDYESKLELLESVDIFCLPSKFDSFGMVYLEALAANIPVVALNYQAIPDVVPRQFGVLCDNNDPLSLSSAIVQAHLLGEINSAEYVLDNFSPEFVTKRFLENVKYSG